MAFRASPHPCSRSFSDMSPADSHSAVFEPTPESIPPADADLVLRIPDGLPTNIHPLVITSSAFASRRPLTRTHRTLFSSSFEPRNSILTTWPSHIQTSSSPCSIPMPSGACAATRRALCRPSRSHTPQGATRPELRLRPYPRRHPSRRPRSRRSPQLVRPPSLRRHASVLKPTETPDSRSLHLCCPLRFDGSPRPQMPSKA